MCVGHRCRALFCCYRRRFPVSSHFLILVLLKLQGGVRPPPYPRHYRMRRDMNRITVHTSEPVPLLTHIQSRYISLHSLQSTTTTTIIIRRGQALTGRHGCKRACRPLQQTLNKNGISQLPNIAKASFQAFRNQCPAAVTTTPLPTCQEPLRGRTLCSPSPDPPHLRVNTQLCCRRYH